MENTVEMVVKVGSQGQAVPKNQVRSWDCARRSSRDSSGRRPGMSPSFCRRYVVLQYLCWAEEGGGTVTGP